ncbi:hypothetical protein [Halothiobacillus sp.]|uniref:O-antigen ligase family protein n=1 Tax=Halothiobacillus sp. TaxID=1891311 RepID=UPI002AD3E868|nr:hypothetical protein [Halothiobacillus sp.]
MKLLTTYKLLTLTGLALLVFQGLLFLGQAAAFQYVPFGPKEIKASILLTIFGAALLLMIAQPYSDKAGFRLIALYSIFLFFNLVVLAGNNPESMWAPAFLYNYSLTIIIFPLATAALACERRQVSLKYGSLAFKASIATILAITAVTFYETAEQYNIFQPWADVLNQNEVIKFGQLGGVIRPSSIFKSPIDYSYFNAVISGLILIIFLRTRSIFYFFIFVALSVCQVLIMVRSGMVAYLAIVGFIFLTESTWKDKTASLMIGVPVTTIFIGSFYDRLLETILNPTNLYIRLNNWSDLLSHIWDTGNILVGAGIVQNGNYGARNSIVIDNMYVGIIYTGGIVGLAMFVLLIALSYQRIFRSHDTLGSWKMAALTGLLCAGFFENTMHLMYMFILPFFFRMTISQRTTEDRASRPHDNSLTRGQRQSTPASPG